MFTSPLQFEIEYECLCELSDGAKKWRGVLLKTKFELFIAFPTASADLEWKLTYVGSAETDEHDQVLDSVLVGPVAVGSYRFIFQVCTAIAQTGRAASPETSQSHTHVQHPSARGPRA